MAVRVIPHSSYNVLNLDQPELYSGRVEFYDVNQQQLTLKFFSQQDELSASFKIHFAVVHYIDLPARWQGANIHTASEERCWEVLMQVLGPSVAKPDMKIKNELLEEFRLFIIHVRQVNYRILASNAIELAAP